MDSLMMRVLKRGDEAYSCDASATCGGGDKAWWRVGAVCGCARLNGCEWLAVEESALVMRMRGCDGVRCAGRMSRCDQRCMTSASVCDCSCGHVGHLKRLDEKHKEQTGGQCGSGMSGPDGGGSGVGGRAGRASRAESIRVEPRVVAVRVCARALCVTSTVGDS